MRYDLEILRRFHPATFDGALERAAVDASRAIGLSSARRLREIHAFASSVDLADERAIQDTTVAFARAVHRDDFALLGPLKRLRATMGARASGSEPHARQGASP
jgi:hypothetical protein